jgi:hypothetical protein
MRGALLAMALCACVPDNGPLMRPGEDCMACHGGDGSILPERVRDAKAWTAAGTVFDPADTAMGIEGAQVRITDADGFSFALRTNLAGNFYTRETIRLPLQACIARNGATMCQQGPVTSGACNSCHGLAALRAPQPPLTAP